MQVADGAIVGSWVKHEGVVENPVDAARVRRFVQAARRYSSVGGEAASKRSG
jgi:predicted TIM-barrel enzyme